MHTYRSLTLACIAASIFLWTPAANAAATQIAAIQPVASAALLGSPIEVKGIPDPKKAVVIKNGQPFTVPAGKIFVLTALGSSSATPNTTQFKVNGSVEVSVTNISGSTMVEVPPHLTAPAGAQLIVEGSSTVVAPEKRAWGYLLDQ